MTPFDHPEFWNPKIRGPICFNPPAARSVWPLTIKRTELVLARAVKRANRGENEGARHPKRTSHSGRWCHELHDG
jgi:hypothetical protein